MKWALYIGWTQSLVATIGSICMSMVFHFQPCTLCWYERIMMFPLFFILTVGILQKDAKVWRYVLPLSMTGLLISFYHNLLYYGVIPETISPCMVGVSCTTRQLNLFGFVTIPLLSFVAFAIITCCMGIAMRKKTL